jgi:amidophosphoribosyltransferase
MNKQARITVYGNAGPGVAENMMSGRVHVKGFDELDGFYTFLMGTKDQLALIRDAFACKPAVVAETDDYVAIASEFRSLAKLPDVKHAKIFEPKPEEMYVWRV